MVSAQPANSSARDDKQPALSVPEKEQKIREIVVLPAPDAIDASRKRVGGTANATDDALARTAQFVADKTKECRQVGIGNGRRDGTVPGWDGMDSLGIWRGARAAINPLLIQAAHYFF